MAVLLGNMSKTVSLLLAPDFGLSPRCSLRPKADVNLKRSKLTGSAGNRRSLQLELMTAPRTEWSLRW